MSDAPEQPHAVVTGASRGIGKAIALRLAREGYVVWALARSSEALDALRAEASGSRGEVKPLVMNAESADDVLRAAADVARVATPFVLINNAGIAPSAPLASTELDTYEQVMAVNVRAPFLLCRELVPKMAARGGGRVVNIASTAALKGFKYTSAYCASKHALLGLTRSLAVEFARKQVTVNAICPGWTDTSLLTASATNIARATGRSEQDARETLARMNPMGRFVQPEEIAELCLFLTSSAAGAITGSVYAIDGGELA